jgi:hypothetical protein
MQPARVAPASVRVLAPMPPRGEEAHQQVLGADEGVAETPCGVDAAAQRRLGAIGPAAQEHLTPDENAF